MQGSSQSSWGLWSASLEITSGKLKDFLTVSNGQGGGKSDGGWGQGGGVRWGAEWALMLPVVIVASR